jgi:hypothetical protein
MNPRSYPTGPRYGAKRPAPPSEPKRARRVSVQVVGFSVVALAAFAAVFAVMLWPSSEDSAEQRDSRISALDATRPSDVAVVLPTPTPRAEPSPRPTETPQVISVRYLALTVEEIDSTIRFAYEMLDVETKQRRINRDYRMYDIDLLSHWVGESVAGAEHLLSRQKSLLDELQSFEPSVEQAAVVLAMYEDSVQEEKEAFEGLLAALRPLNEAGVSVVVGIRSGMLSHFGASDGLSRAAMIRRAAREELAVLVNRAGTTLGELETSRSEENGVF